MQVLIIINMTSKFIIFIECDYNCTYTLYYKINVLIMTGWINKYLATTYFEKVITIQSCN